MSCSPPNSPLRFGVIGAGATGGYLAAVLAYAGYPVTVIARGANREAILKRGLLVEGPGSQSMRPRPAVVLAPGEPVDPVDVVLFCVKSYDTESAASTLDTLLGKDGRILCLQNGVTNEGVLVARFGEEHVIPGVMYIGAERRGWGHIRVSTPARVLFGSKYPENRDLITKIKDAFDAAGIACSVNDDILAEKWQKFLFNYGLNPLTALTNRKLGSILASAEGRGLFEALIDEAIIVAKSIGAPLALDARERVLETARRMNISSSMAEDLAAGRRIETEAFSGYIRKLGAARGIPTPVTAVLDSLLALNSTSTT